MKKQYLFWYFNLYSKGKRGIATAWNSYKIIRTPVQYRNGSCGYSLLVINRVDESVEILRAMNIPVQGVYPADLE